MTTTLAKTPLYQWHADHRGKLVDFAGWSMPIQYTSIVDEHVATRTKATLFDVSHMGRFQFRGAKAESFLDSLLTRRVTGMKPGQIRYSLVCKEDGGILDDVLVYRLVDTKEQPFFALVVNASNREKLVKWIEQHLPASDVEFVDTTLDTAMIAVQGPVACDLVKQTESIDVSELKNYYGRVLDRKGLEIIVSRTGYTGEDGCELVVPSKDAAEVWTDLLAAGGEQGVIAAGLGARDTLRLEAAMPLYGHELSEEINPVQAGLGFAINTKDRDFIGRDAIEAARSDSTLPKRIGLTMQGKRVPREGYSITKDGNVVGTVTSGTFSPTLQQPIAMGYVSTEVANAGTELQIDLRGKLFPAVVSPLPFYARS